MARIRALIVVTYRQHELALTGHPFGLLRTELLARGELDEVQLGQLGPEAVRQYIESTLAGERISGELPALVFQRTEGNPLFMTDLVRYWQQVGFPQPSSMPTRDVPDSVRSVIERTLGRLHPDTRELLSIGSVEGDEFETAVLARVSGRTAADVEELLRRVAQASALVTLEHEAVLPDGTISARYRFVHVLYQDALVDAIAPSRRTEWARTSHSPIVCYALLEIDQGRARDAMVRLISRGLAGSAQPELYAALVQACRFCGLLEASIAAHERACELDSTLATSGYQTFFQLGDYDRALRETVRPPILDALLLGMRGEPERAIEMLREREARGPTGVLRSLMASVRAVFEKRADSALENARPIFDAFPDPEVVFYAARTIAFFGDVRALSEFGRALDRGFVPYRVLLRDDPWLDPLRSTREFQALLERSRQTYRECLKAYVEAGGKRLLGPVPNPEELEPNRIVNQRP